MRYMQGDNGAYILREVWLGFIGMVSGLVAPLAWKLAYLGASIGSYH